MNMNFEPRGKETDVKAVSLGREADMRNFKKLFHETARYRHRYEVFRDFIFMSAASLHNAVLMNDEWEKEYLEIIARYEKQDQLKFPKLLDALVSALNWEPRDVLGPIFMDLEISNKHQGQFFSPPEISDLMAALSIGDIEAALEGKPYLSVSEPACGSGGMILAVVRRFLEKGIVPADRLWVHCIDVDRTAALMCFIQLSLWHVPAEIVVGNALTLETREVWRTPAYYMGNWAMRLQVHSPS